MDLSFIQFFFITLRVLASCFIENQVWQVVISEKGHINRKKNKYKIIQNDTCKLPEEVEQHM